MLIESDLSILELAERGDQLAKEGKTHEAIEIYLQCAASKEVPSEALCLKLARNYQKAGSWGEAYQWALRVVDAGDNFAAWQSGLSIAHRCSSNYRPLAARHIKLALAASFTTDQMAQMFELALRRLGIDVEVYQGQYGQYCQEILNPGSQLYAFAPDFIVVAVQEGDLLLPELSDAPDQSIAHELQRWTGLWDTASKHSTARVIQFNFAQPVGSPFGHLATRLDGSRYAMTQVLNSRLGQKAASSVSIVDCDHLSGLFGKHRWFDPRYWYLSRQGISLDALPFLARHTAAVVAADIGLSRKCLVLDLDNTLWGGVVGEEGVAGIKLGGGVEGDAFLDFQEYILGLKNKGVILAVCSKNNDADAKEPFEKHPEMRLKLDDFALFIANWQPKPDNLHLIANQLNLGLDALVFLDDNPAERSVVRRLLPQVDVVLLPPDPTQYRRTLSEYLLFETSSYTPQDAARTHQYQARARIAEAEVAATSLEEFYSSLQMRAVVAPFDALHLDRVAQLIAKTNQFNLTTRRHSLGQIQGFMNDPRCLHFYLKLRDAFTDHGLVSVVLAVQKGGVLDVDTWLMSCRVIGRTVEATVLEHLCRTAQQAGCTTIRGTFIPTAKNAPVRDLFKRFGFSLVTEEPGGASVWTYDLERQEPIRNHFIDIVEAWEDLNDVA